MLRLGFTRQIEGAAPVMSRSRAVLPVDLWGRGAKVALLLPLAAALPPHLHHAIVDAKAPTAPVGPWGVSPRQALGGCRAPGAGRAGGPRPPRGPEASCHSGATGPERGGKVAPRPAGVHPARRTSATLMSATSTTWSRARPGASEPVPSHRAGPRWGGASLKGAGRRPARWSPDCASRLAVAPRRAPSLNLVLVRSGVLSRGSLLQLSLARHQLCFPGPHTASWC